MKLLSKIFGKTEQLYDKKIDGTGVALVRIIYSIVLLCEVLQLFYFRHLVFDKVPYLNPAEIKTGIPLVIWMVVLLFLMVGLFTRVSALLNYMFSVVFIATIGSYEYHMFYVYMGVNSLLLFLNTSQVLSLDNLLAKWKHSNTRFTYIPPGKISVLNYYVPVLLAIAFVYLDSVFYKVTSHNWMSGLGMWVPASIPHMTRFDASIILNSKFLSLALGYTTLVFEAVFIFLFFRSGFRWLFFVIGVGLHLGIALVFPIPWFGFGVTALYLLLVPVSFWRKLAAAFKFNKPKARFYYDAECPLCIRTKIAMEHFDVLGAVQPLSVQQHADKEPALSDLSRDELLDNIYAVKNNGKRLKGVDVYKYILLYMPLLFPLGLLLHIPGIYHLAKFIYRKIAENRYVERCTEDNCGYTPPVVPQSSDSVKLAQNITVKQLKVCAIASGIALLSLLQLNSTLHSALAENIKKVTGFKNSRAEHVFDLVSDPLRYGSRVFFGITSHPVFMDDHFTGYNRVLAVQAHTPDGKKHWLPMIDSNGQVGYYCYSFAFVKWTFRVASPKIRLRETKAGIRDFTTFWLVKNRYPIKQVTFAILAKPNTIPTEWEYDFLRSQMQQPWMQVGTAGWKNGEYSIDLSGLDKL